MRVSCIISGNRYYDPEIERFIQVDPMWDKYPSLTPYQYCANNPLRFVDRNGMWISEANAEKFINFARRYLNQPYSKIDCSKLVVKALHDMNEIRVKTQFYKNMSVLLNDINAIKKGDLIVTEGHVEIVSEVNIKEGTIRTIASSSGKGKVIERRPFNPSRKESWWYKIFKKEGVSRFLCIFLTVSDLCKYLQRVMFNRLTNGGICHEIRKSHHPETGEGTGNRRNNG